MERLLIRMALFWLLICCVSAVSAGENEVVLMANPDENVFSGYISCTEPCRCMAESEALGAWGTEGYIRCDQRPCGEIFGSAVVLYRYCFRQKTVITVPVTVTTTPEPVRMVADEDPVRYAVAGGNLQQSDEVPALTGAPAGPVPAGTTVAARQGTSSKEALVALGMAVGKLPAHASYDMNGDGVVDSADAREILRQSVLATQGA